MKGLRARARAASWLVGVSMLAALGVARAQPSASAGAPDDRAAGGVDLIAALETSPAVVVGRVSKVARLDVHGRAATLTVERPLSGALADGERVRIGWEELAASRSDRFGKGDRVLVALEPLPGASLWTQRFPERARGATVWAVAREGGAFARRPSPGDLDALDHYLRLSPAERAQGGGVGQLARLVAFAQPTIALAAVERLGAVASLDERLDPGSAERLVAGLLRGDVGRRGIDAQLALIAAQRLEALRPALERRASALPLAPPSVFEALARLEGGLAAADAERLVDASAEHRLAVARYAQGAGAEARLAKLVGSDPDPAVRAAAVGRLIELQGVDAEDVAVGLLDDRDAGVRYAAAVSFGSLGEPAVEPLRRAIEVGSREAATAAVAGLRAAGLAGEPTLVEVARSHPDAGVRTLARVAIGGSLDDHHRH